MKISSLVTSGLVLLGTAMTARAAVPCDYGVFRAGNLARELGAALSAVGVTGVPIVTERGPEGTELIRGPVTVGRMALRQDSRSEFARLDVEDPSGAPLFQVIESTFPCPLEDPPGLCRRIDIFTFRDATVPAPAFTVIRVPAGEIQYERYGQLVDAPDFQSQLLESVHWLAGALVRTETLGPIAPLTPKEALLRALAADPDIAPYLPRVHLYRLAGRLHIAGVVPSNQIWDLILIHAQRLGLYNVVPDMVIDGRIRPVVGEPIGLGLAGCLP